MHQTARKLSDHLNSCFIERQEVVFGMLVALVSRQHMLLIGPPGTAKSNLISEMAGCISGAEYFQWLLSRFSTPDELFGPVSLKALEQGIYQRNTKAKLPEAHFAFVDEIFKANSAILNSLLTTINERLFYNNGSPIKIPLMSLFGASNEYPEEDENLEALYDRFLLRYEVKPITEDAAFKSMLTAKGYTQRPRISLDELIKLQQQVQSVNIGPEIYDIFVSLRKKLAEEKIYPSDRRWRQSLDLTKSAAALRDASQVVPQDLNILEAVLWQEPRQKKIVAGLIREFSIDKLTQELERILNEAREIGENAANACSTEAGTEANKKLKVLTTELDELKGKHPSKIQEIDNYIKKTREINKQVLSVCLGI